MIVNIHTTVSDFSFPFFEYMKENYTNTSSKKNELVFYAYCLDNKSYNKASQIVNSIKSIESRGTDGHCNGVKSIFSNLKNTAADSFDIICDSDTVMLVNSWDIIIENILRKVGILGSSYEKIGGYSSGNSNVQTYKNKPNLTWFAISRRYDFSKIQLDPGKNSHLDISNERLSDLYQLPIGYKLLKDAGWQIPSYLNDNSIPYKTLSHEKPTALAKVLKTNQDYHEEFQLDGIPFVAHQRGSMSKEFRKHKLSKSFYDVLDAYFNEVGSQGKILENLDF